MPAEQDSTNDSPQFKVAFSQENNDLESPDNAGKKRKSLGRRVSFASKAKIRFIGKDNVDSDDQKENAALAKNDEEDNVFLVSKPPMIRPEPVPKVELSPNLPKDEEVELKDSRCSFSSYDSNEDTMIVDKTFLDDMDMTNPVGGIIQVVSQTLTAINEVDSNNTTMDLTTCIGGILQNIPPYAEESNSDSTIHMITTKNPIIINTDAMVEQENPPSPSSVDTMELTRTVGGIMQSLTGPNNIEPSPSQKKFTRPSPLGMESIPPNLDEEGPAEEMDMTVVLKDTIKVNAPVAQVKAENKTNSSPYKSYSPGRIIRLQRQKMMDINDSPMSFIGDMDTPKELGAGASPIPPRRAIDVVEDMDLTTELFNRYIDTSRLTELNFTSSQVAPQSQSQLQNVPATPKAVQTPLILPELPPSQSESPTISNFMPRASLNEFLHETGIRFMDYLCSMKRRETMGRPRESEMVTSAKQLYIDCGLALECDALEEACGVLNGFISKVHETLKLQEEQFNHSPPLAYLQYRDPAEQPTVLSKLKTLKSIARSAAILEWYKFRHPIHVRLNAVLEGNREVLHDRLFYLTNLVKRLDEMIADAEGQVNTLKQNLTDARNKHKNIALTAEELSHVRHLEGIFAEQCRKIEHADEEMSNLIKEEAELRMSIEKALKKRQELQQNVHSLKQQVDTTPELSPLLLDELRASFALLQGVTGWKLVKMTETVIELQYARDEVKVALHINKEESNVFVQSVSLSSGKAKSRLLRHAGRLVKLETGNLTVPQCLHHIGRKLDRLMHLDRQLNIVSVQCTVSIPSPDTLSGSTDSVPIALGFLHHPSHTKFDVLLNLAPSPSIQEALWLSYSQFLPFAGRIQEHHVKDGVHLALNNRYFPIRKAVASIVDIMDTLCDS